MSEEPTPRGPRPRAHGIRIGTLPPGAHNAITDVPGVRVGHVTIWRDEPPPPDGSGVARTGVTVVVPADPATLVERPLPAGACALNGAGELTGFLQVREWGLLETPIHLTSTMQVGRVFDGAVDAARAANSATGDEYWVIPIVGECDDSWLSDARTTHVEAADVGRALSSASSGPVVEGAVGAGCGMTTLGWKGGIGTASRVLASLDATLGVLVLSNFGSFEELRIDGVPVGPELGNGVARDDHAGSCIVVVLTDATLDAASLERVARRCGLGLARMGSVAHHGSGEIFLAASTRSPTAPDAAVPLRGTDLDPLFQATVEATEEAVLNALWAAPDVVGRDGRLARGLPHDAVLELLQRAGRL